MTKYDKDNLDWPYLIEKGQVTYEEALAGGYEPEITVVTTESGSVYHIDSAGKHLMRANSEHEKRADSDWIPFVNHSEIRVGARVALLLKSLAGHGPDDHGNVVDPNEEPYTHRITTPVVSIDN